MVIRGKVDSPNEALIYHSLWSIRSLTSEILCGVERQKERGRGNDHPQKRLGKGDVRGDEASEAEIKGKSVRSLHILKQYYHQRLVSPRISMVRLF